MLDKYCSLRTDVRWRVLWLNGKLKGYLTEILKTALCSYCSYGSYGSQCFGLFRSVRRQTAYLRNNCAFYTLFPLLLQIRIFKALWYLPIDYHLHFVPECMYVFRVILTINADYRPIEHSPVSAALYPKRLAATFSLRRFGFDTTGRPYGICGAENDTRIGVSSRTLDLFCQRHCTNSAYKLILLLTTLHCLSKAEVATWHSPSGLSLYRGAEKSLARPTSRCILFDGENISFDASLVIYINSINIPPIMIINGIYEHQNLLWL